MSVFGIIGQIVVGHHVLLLLFQTVVSFVESHAIDVVLDFQFLAKHIEITVGHFDLLFVGCLEQVA